MKKQRLFNQDWLLRSTGTEWGKVSGRGRSRLWEARLCFCQSSTDMLDCSQLCVRDARHGWWTVQGAYNGELTMWQARHSNASYMHHTTDINFYMLLLVFISSHMVLIKWTWLYQSCILFQAPTTICKEMRSTVWLNCLYALLCVHPQSLNNKDRKLMGQAAVTNVTIKHNPSRWFHQASSEVPGSAYKA